MILLLGGTSETPEIANLLAENGIEVLISNLTGSASGWELSGGIRLRYGGLDAGAMCGLIAEEGITAIVDAGHPYAEELHNNAVESCSRMNISYFRYERPGADYDGCDVEFADGHEDGAELAFRIGHRILLTTGSRNLAPYVQAARDTGSKLYVRVLPGEESTACCRDSGVDQDAIIAGLGPFTAKCNIELIKKHSIDVLVTKDSGLAGGVAEKLQAAGACGIKVVVIRRPVIRQKTGECFEVISELIEQVSIYVEEH
ncbi:MAG: precorrin-6A reductase [Planctomycetes bacterium]|nr:precorrin-6A reductase [Planctomycetota bacterium]